MNIKVSAPAKINLMLDVTGKRNDGYHTLSTVMQSISLADVVTISKNNTSKITVKASDLSIPSNEKNIAYIASEKFFEYTNIQGVGLDIKIEKVIPYEAGLGGGSADAAAVLVGLNRIFDTNLSPKQLCNIGVTIGADVPFCIVGGTKFCTGIGEIISNAPLLEQCYIVVAKGTSGISTKNAFEKIDAIGFDIQSDYTQYDGSIESIKKTGNNKFELVSNNVDIEFIKNTMLKMNSQYSAMSGSGSAVFGLFYNKYSAQRCHCFLAESGLFSTLCYPRYIGAEIIEN